MTAIDAMLEPLEPAIATALIGGLAFVLLVLVSTIAARPSMFTGRFARRHRLSGLALLCWLLVGFADALRPPQRPLLPRQSRCTTGWPAGRPAEH